ncbi:lycopene cyclase [Streptomyces alfalfae]|uniref:Lycopene cyclase n=1 Tax=Streptomyces alfalfae TaxID=1642299 RepID=A0ABN4VUM1_9ACTN|nr:lycopene cyclase family protein [Streptomyces alfalfae]APY89802.1 lycopene cyclase [Streptomyces alfalfae]AYA20255.1 lycopene cyclase [Streptomyces fradiae]RXX43745.1 lycopene cyclase [Streptomyces alfalfae]RZN05790.1 lycopene cyclase [Streptomyces alfalfae]
MADCEIAVVGAGAAGLSLAHRLCAPEPGWGPVPSVTLVDAPPGPARPPERTWCYWEAAGGEFDEALSAVWDTLRVRAPDGTPVVGSPAPLRYKMLRSTSFETLVAARLDAEPRVRRLTAHVDEVRDAGDGAEVRGTTPEGRPVTLRARWVFDSRPLRELPPARTRLLQHFRGWHLTTEQPVFDARVADLMDFRTPQPARGLSFAYVLPLTSRQALVEYTEFSAAPLGEREYERALHDYARRHLGIGRFTVTRAEQGVIPMTDARFPRRAGRSVFRIGTAGGATRPSTGYTFAAVQRQSRAVAAACRQGRDPRPPPAHSARSLAMDAVLLRALDTGRVAGAPFFTGLFQHVPMARLLRFLDGGTRWTEDIGIGLRTPVRPMLRTALELPWLPRRAHPEAGRGTAGRSGPGGPNGETPR